MWEESFNGHDDSKPRGINIAFCVGITQTVCERTSGLRERGKEYLITVV